MTKCNKCQSTNVMHQVWGRTEYWVCKDCKQEIVDTPIEQNVDWTFKAPESTSGVWDALSYGHSPFFFPDDEGGVP